MYQPSHYAGSTKLLRDIVPRWGIERTFVDQTRMEEFEAALRPNIIATHVAAMWSHQHNAEQRRAMGISDGLVRISIGAEDERDLLNNDGKCTVRITTSEARK